MPGECFKVGICKRRNKEKEKKEIGGWICSNFKGYLNMFYFVVDIGTLKADHCIQWLSEWATSWNHHGNAKQMTELPLLIKLFLAKDAEVDMNIYY